MRRFFSFLFLAFLIFQSEGTSQKANLALKTGIGIYQGYHIGIDYFYLKNAKLGVNIGSRVGLKPSNFYDVFGNGEIQNLLVTIENSFHFGTRYKPGIKAWIFGQHFMYYEASFYDSKYKILSIIPTVGRMFDLSNRVKFFIEFGPSFGIELDRKKLYHGMITPSPDPSHNWVDIRLQIAYIL